MKFFALVTMLAGGCSDDGGPRLDAVMPAAIPAGGMVTMTGSRLCGESSDCSAAAGEVLIGLALPQTQAQIVSYDDTSALIVIPSITPAGKTDLIVTVDERSSNALPFEVL
jgi:hypothetical protein